VIEAMKSYTMFAALREALAMSSRELHVRHMAEVTRGHDALVGSIRTQEANAMPQQKSRTAIPFRRASNRVTSCTVPSVAGKH
jgi:hypothetical protein